MFLGSTGSCRVAWPSEKKSRRAITKKVAHFAMTAMLVDPGGCFPLVEHQREEAVLKLEEEGKGSGEALNREAHE